MRKKNYLSLLIILAATFLVACGPRENCAHSYDDDRTNLAQICTDKKKYDFGEPIHITFTVTNISDEVLVFNSGDEPAVDICVRGECWSDEQESILELVRVTLQPGESHIIEWTWPTSQTDLEPFESIYPIPSIHVFGDVIPLPGASPGSTSVVAYYRGP